MARSEDLHDVAQAIGLTGPSIEDSLRRLAPLGVPMWIWPDGAAIVRCVTADEVEMFAWQNLRDVVPAVFCSGDSDAEFDTPDRALFFYVRPFEQADDPALVDGNKRLIRSAFEISDSGTYVGVLEGRGNDRSVDTDLVRSRIYQFFNSMGMFDLGRHFSDAAIQSLWHEHLLVSSRLLDAVQQLRENWAKWSDDDYGVFLTTFSNSQPDPDYREIGYLNSLRKLLLACDPMMSAKLNYDAGVPSIGQEAYEQLVEADRWDDLLSHFDIGDEDEEAFTEAFKNSDNLREFVGQRSVSGWVEAVLSPDPDDLSSAAHDLVKVAHDEIYALNTVLSTHDISIPSHDQPSMWGYRAEVKPENTLSMYDEPVVEVGLDIDGEGRTTWMCGGRDSRMTERSINKGHVGALHELRAQGWIETKEELDGYSATDPVWIWPGEPLVPWVETNLLMGVISFDRILDLGPFLEVSFDQGLLTPVQIGYWADYLISTGRNVARSTLGV